MDFKHFKIASVVAALLLSTSVNASTILISEYYSADLTPIETALESAGHTVDIIDGTMTNAIADAMSATAYDQVFVFDVTTNNFMSTSDLDALTSLYNNSSSMVIDAQAYNYIVWDTSDTDGLTFLTNVANEFDNYGGGIYLGFDGPMAWTNNANAVLDTFGMDTITSSTNYGISTYDNTSPLFTGVNPLNWGSSSYGVAISGIQGSQNFEILASDINGNALITASFVASEVPVPATVWLFGSGLIGLAGMVKRKKSTS